MSRGHAVVTGATGAIGGALARACADAGYELVLVARERRTTLVGAHVVVGDLADEDDVVRMCDELRKLERVAMVVHAAASFRVGAFADLSAADLDALFRINVYAPFALTQALLPAVRAAAGTVVFVNSSAGANAAGAANGGYAATKHALRALADALRAEENANGVRVLSVYPGRTAGPLQERLHGVEGRRYDASALLQPSDVASVVMSAVRLPATAEATDIHLRPMRKQT